MTTVKREGQLLPALAEATQLGLIAEEHSFAHGARKDALSDSIHERLDRLIDDLLLGFPENQPATVAVVKPVLERHHDLTSESFADLDEDVIPLVIVRELVSRHKLVVRQEHVPAWSRFVDRYRAVCYT